MDAENDVVFREEQRFSCWIVGFLVAVMAVTVVVEFFAFRKAISEQQATLFLSVVIVGAGMVVPIGVSAMFLLLKLETEVRAGGLYVRFFPVHIKFKKFCAEDLSECYARAYRPLVEYGGWGIRFGKQGRAYNVSGKKGVQLVLKNGKRLLIGSQKSEELAAAISSFMKKV